MHDVVIIGGSYAGIAAAMPLARARRDVLVLDGGKRRNRFAAESHGFLGQDGVDPAVIAQRGKNEVLAYSTVTWRDEEATGARRDGDAFVVTTASGEHRARRVVLATGVVDELPDVSGVRERFGRTIFHCPYCHGYELNRGKLGVLATVEHSFVQAALVSEWSAPGDTTVFLSAKLEATKEQLADLEARGIRIERTPVLAVDGGDHGVVVRVEGGREHALAGLFVATRMRIAGPFAEQLGCEIETHPNGAFYKTDPMTKETTSPGVFACGDTATPMTTLPFAVADGFRAGVGTHRSLVFAAG
jgi:thioredoxin reductase